MKGKEGEPSAWSASDAGCPEQETVSALKKGAFQESTETTDHNNGSQAQIQRVTQLKLNADIIDTYNSALAF